MNEFLDLPVKTRIQNDIVSTFIDARELHGVLNSKREYNHWIKYKLKQSMAVREQDFIIHREDKFVFREKNGKQYKIPIKQIDYFVTIEIAKHIAMVEGTDTGRKVRQYFIDRDKELQKILAQNIRYSNELQRIVKTKYITILAFANAHNISYSLTLSVLRGESANQEIANILYQEFGIKPTKQLKVAV